MSQTNARLQGGGVVLPQGASPGNVNVGEKALIIDTDGLLKMQDSAGNKGAASGGWVTMTPLAAPAASITLSGIANQDIIIVGRIVTPSGAGAEDIKVRPNGADTNCESHQKGFSTGGDADSAPAYLSIAGITASNTVDFEVRLKFNGAARLFVAEAFRFIAGPTRVEGHATGRWNDSATVLSTVTIQLSGGSNLDTGTVVYWKPA